MLHDPIIFSRSFDDSAAFEDVVAARLFDQHVLSRLAGPDGQQRVPMVGRRDGDGVECALSSSTPRNPGRTRGILPATLLHAALRREQAAVGINQPGDFHIAHLAVSRECAACPRPLIPATAMRTRSFAPSTRPEVLVPAMTGPPQQRPRRRAARKAADCSGTCDISRGMHRSFVGGTGYGRGWCSMAASSVSCTISSCPKGYGIRYFTPHGAGEFDQLIIVPPRHRRQSNFLVAGLECGARFGQRELQAGRLQRPDIDRSFIAADDQLPPLVSLHFQRRRANRGGGSGVFEHGQPVVVHVHVGLRLPLIGRNPVGLPNMLTTRSIRWQPKMYILPPRNWPSH